MNPYTYFILPPQQEAVPETTLDAVVQAPDIGAMILLLAGLGIAPFVLAMATSFARLVIVGGLLRQALGLQQIPPTSVLTGIALVLTITIMSPVIEQSWTAAQSDMERGQKIEAVHDAFRGFFERMASTRNVELFREIRADQVAAARATDGEQPEAPVLDESAARMFETLTVYLPAFVLTELTTAFIIGFLIFLPFLVIDLVVSNILLALGMHMLSPVTISLPLKIILFVLRDGWTLVLGGVISSYGIST